MVEGIVKQKIQILEEQLLSIEGSIKELPFASKLKMPVSKYIGGMLMISGLDRHEIMWFKPYMESYLNKEIEIARLKKKMVDFYCDKYEKTKNKSYLNEASKYVVQPDKILQEENDKSEYEDISDICIEETSSTDESPSIITNNIDVESVPDEIKNIFYLKYHKIRTPSIKNMYPIPSEFNSKVDNKDKGYIKQRLIQYCTGDERQLLNKLIDRL